MVCHFRSHQAKNSIISNNLRIICFKIDSTRGKQVFHARTLIEARTSSTSYEIRRCRSHISRIDFLFHDHIGTDLQIPASADEDVFMAPRRRLQVPAKTSSSLHEGIFIKSVEIHRRLHEERPPGIPLTLSSVPAPYQLRCCFV